MKTMLYCAVAMMAMMSCNAGNGCRLPGEDGEKLAISPAPFPDRMSAYVWRNWGLVDKALLADVVGATAEDLFR